MADPLSRLVEQSQQLVTDVGVGTYYYRRDVPQLNEDARRVAGRDDATMSDVTQANFLLSTRGFNVEEYRTRLDQVQVDETFGAPAAADPASLLDSTDVEGFLSAQMEATLAAVLEESRVRARGDHAEMSLRALETDWGSTKKTLIENWGPVVAGSASVGAGMSMAMSTPFREQQQRQNEGLGALSMDQRVVRYATVVEELVKGGGKGKAVSMFAQAMSELGAGEQGAVGEWRREMADCWKCLDLMLRNLDQTRDEAERERLLAKGAREFLEWMYGVYVVEEVLRQDLKTATIGGVPSVRERVRGYLRVRYRCSGKSAKWPANLECLEGQCPAWAELFFCCRMGNFKEAMAVADSSPILQPFAQLLASFVQSLETGSLPDRNHTSMADAEAIRIEQQKQPDPFKLVLYRLVSRKRNQKPLPEDVITSSHDYLWFCLAQGANAPTLSENVPFVLRDNASNPERCAQLCFLCLSFDSGVRCLWEHQQYRADALHIALALHIHNALKSPPGNLSGEALLRGDAFCDGTINVARLVKLYVFSLPSNFHLRPLYLPLLRDQEAADACAKDLALESKTWHILLPQGGELDRALGRDRWAKVIRMAAAECERTCRFDDAIWLYNNEGSSPDKVTELFCTQLGRLVSRGRASVVSATPGPAAPASSALSERQRVIDRALEHLKGGQGSQKRLVDELTSLLQLANFFDCASSERYDEALRILDSVGLVPLVPDCATVALKADAVKRSPKEIVENLPDVLLTAMNCVLHLYTSVKAKTGGLAPGESMMRSDRDRVNYMNSLRDKARAIVMFAGMVPVRLPGDTTNSLLRSELQLA